MEVRSPPPQRCSTFERKARHAMRPHRSSLPSTPTSSTPPRPRPRSAVARATVALGVLSLLVVVGCADLEATASPAAPTAAESPTANGPANGLDAFPLDLIDDEGSAVEIAAK